MSTRPRRKAAGGDILRNYSEALERRLGTIEYREIDSLRGYERHARKHPERQIVQLLTRSPKLYQS